MWSKDWPQGKQDLHRPRLYELAGLSPRHVLKREHTRISIMSEISTVGAGVRAGSILTGFGRGGGGWWRLKNLHHWAAPRLAAMGLWSMSGGLSSPVLILGREWGCFKWDSGGLEGGDIFSFRWSDEIGLRRVAHMKSKMISALLTGTQTRIKKAVAATWLRHKNIHVRAVYKFVLGGKGRHSLLPNQCGVLLWGPLVDYPLAGAWTGQPPAPNYHPHVRHWHKIAWKWWSRA